ncbi:hypothetical protein W02_00920 [Nitrospira sp. KM1]|nr:hypothetical protein W02_00920 [Nitrospira sp. KM1]
MSVTVADGREPVSAQCLEAKRIHSHPPAHRLWGQSFSQVSPARPERLKPLLPGPYAEPLRFTPCRIRHGTTVNAAEMVRRKCPARTQPGEGVSCHVRAGG